MNMKRAESIHKCFKRLGSSSQPSKHDATMKSCEGKQPNPNKGKKKLFNSKHSEFINTWCRIIIPH